MAARHLTLVSTGIDEITAALDQLREQVSPTCSGVWIAISSMMPPLIFSGFSHIIIRFYTLLGLLCHVQQGHWKTEGTYHASYRTKPHDLILSSQRWARHTNLWHSTDCICVLQWLSWMGSLHGHCVHLPGLRAWDSARERWFVKDHLRQAQTSGWETIRL